jgi:hypothetical protein
VRAVVAESLVLKHQLLIIAGLRRLRRVRRSRGAEKWRFSTIDEAYQHREPPLTGAAWADIEDAFWAPGHEEQALHHERLADSIDRANKRADKHG